MTYHHIELSRHAVILSDGLATESFLDTGADAAMLLSNDGQPEHSSAGSAGPEAQLVRDALACAPMRIIGPEVERVRGRLGLRGVQMAA